MHIYRSADFDYYICRYKLKMRSCCCETASVAME